MAQNIFIPGLPTRLELIRYLHRGAFADVIDAHDRNRAYDVALKILRAGGPQAEVARAMFRRETEALKGLTHDGIVQILDSFEAGADLLCIELELIRGGQTLAHLFEELRIGRVGRPSLEWRLRAIRNLSDAVMEAHRRNVVHRDLKPQNVLWNRDEDALKLSDFGIALVLPLTVRDPRGVTLRSFFTPPYASPEQRLQKAVGFASDVYGFGVLVASILAMKEPGEDFCPESVDEFLTLALAEIEGSGVTPASVSELRELLPRCLLLDAASRPSLLEIRNFVGRLIDGCVRMPEATVALTRASEGCLSSLGFGSPASIEEDFNADLRVRWEHDDRGELLRIYGATLFALLRWSVESPDGEGTVQVVAAGRNPGPKHEADRRRASQTRVRLRIGRGRAGELLQYAFDAHRSCLGQEAREVLDRGKLIIDLERERLPCFEIDCAVEGGHVRDGRREAIIGSASGYEGAPTEEVELSGGFQLRLLAARRGLPPLKPNAVRARLPRRLEQQGDSADETLERDWYSLFDDPRAIDILDDTGHIVGKVSGYDDDNRVIQAYTDKRRRVRTLAQFFVRSSQKEQLLRQQESALAAVARGDAARPDMPALISDPAAHRMGENRWLDLIQPGLYPAERVRELVNRILACESIFCLQGPPGTGKTTIIAEVVAQTLDRDPRARILVCSQANEAVANAVERIRRVRSQLDRDWLIVREVRRAVALQEGDWAGYDAAYKEFRNRVSEGAVRALTAHAENRFVREAQTEWLENVGTASRHIDRDFRRLVQVWGTTTARSGGPLRKLTGDYDLVIVDEAAKATVGEVMVPILHARRLLLVGDQRQLPPFLESTTLDALEQFGVSASEAKRSLFEHLFSLVPSAHRDMLSVQFRMHPTIGAIVSKLFYEDKLQSGPRTDERPLPRGTFDRPHRVMWLDVDGSDRRVGATSRANDDERRAILRILKALNRDVVSESGTIPKPVTVAVIAAYRAQADLIRRDVEREAKRWLGLNVRAATVDSFQGREADVVVYSMVRTGDARRDFIADGRRFNVALSRARSLLVIVGDRRGAHTTERLRQLLDMIPGENQCTVDAVAPDASPGLSAAIGAKWRK